MIEQGIIQLLLGNPTAVGTRPDGSNRSTCQAAFTAAVGDNVFPAKAAQDVPYPYAVVERTGAQHTKALQGVAGIAKTSVVVRVYALLYKDAEAQAENARKLLDGYRGSLANGLAVQAIFQDDDEQTWERPVHADEQGVQAAELRLTVWSNEN